MKNKKSPVDVIDVLRSLIISSIIFLTFCILLSFIFDSGFLLGLLIGFSGSIFWLYSLYKDILMSIRDKRIQRIKFGYFLRLTISGILLFLSSRISLESFFGTFLGLMNTKICILINGFFRRER